MNAIFNRRSIRKYKDKPIEKEKVEKLLRAAMQAPSAANEQPWEFIVVQNKDTLSKLSNMSPYSKMVASCAAAIVLVANTEAFRIQTGWQQDMGAAAENLLLEAVELDLGAVWLGVATSEDASKFITNFFNLPENIKPFALISVGYPDDEQENKFIDRFNESKVHYENWK